MSTYKQLWIDQDYKCAICGTDGNYRASASNCVPLVVDHCHISGNVRGLLCHTCNSALGQFKDSKELLAKAMIYLQAPIIVNKETTKKVQIRKSKDTLADNTFFDIVIDILDNSLYTITNSK